MGALKIFVLTVVTIVVLSVVSYGMFLAYRTFNYTFGYEDMVKKTICETVKPEYLINPTQCKE